MGALSVLAAPCLVLRQARVLRTCFTRVVFPARVGTFSNVDTFAEFSQLVIWHVWQNSLTQGVGERA